MRTHVRILLYTLVFSFLSIAAFAKVSPARYGVVLPADSVGMAQATAKHMDSLLAKNMFLSAKTTISAIEHTRVMVDRTWDFYLLLLLCMMLGVVRYGDPRYFGNMWRVFRNPSQGRAAKEQLEVSVVQNIVMNLFFALVVGAYLYYLARINIPQRTGSVSPSTLVPMLVAGVMLIYAAKYIVIRFSGWAFKIDNISEYYIFNIFLVNKIIAISLLPFVIVMAFGSAALAGPAVVVSVIVIALLFINRYIRSWQVFGSFFQYSKFHFFTYLCASEILPLAVLMKLLVRGLL